MHPHIWAAPGWGKAQEEAPKRPGPWLRTDCGSSSKSSEPCWAPDDELPARTRQPSGLCQPKHLLLTIAQPQGVVCVVGTREYSLILMMKP
ncbi:hypothetical protein J1605_016976 [Eschrichtius robustus]|uniref:Uncharacterized protein n=1 Tax=Eschrichtius robustus TaxID=9764 RepID=A0AB34I2J2_ESCRO|nr:hypothetical protein J1605_016976 [Eschrichtius robustus]